MLIANVATAQSVVWTPSPGGIRFGQDIARIGDLDADGGDDFAVGRNDGVAEIVSGRTGAVIRIHTCPPGSVFAKVTGTGDVDGDGLPDYAIGVGSAENPNATLNPGEAGWVAVFSGATGNELWHAQGGRWRTFLGNSLVAIGDVDGNGRPDLLVASSNYPGGVSSYGGRVVAHDGLTGAVLWTVLGASSPAENLGVDVAACGGDVNADGRPDVLVRSRNPVRVQILSGADGATLRVLTPLTGQEWLDQDGLGDVDRDGVADLVIGMFDRPNDNGSARVYSGATGAEIYAVSWTQGPWTSFGGTVRRLGDLSGDGVSEFAVGTRGFYSYTNPGWVRVYDGATAALRTCMDGSFLTGKVFGAAIEAGDADGDGKKDILVGAPAYRPGIDEAGRVEVYGVLTGGSLVAQPHACGPTRIAVGGQPRIGERISFRVFDAVGLPVVGIGFTLLGLPYCGCTIGHEWGIQLFSDSVWLSIPNDVNLVGLRFAAQGLDVFGTGGCAAPQMTVTDTILVTIG
ncbi:MAG: FG-GAP and VCBS repeat-containing protein [Planctomycetota bacterium]